MVSSRIDRIFFIFHNFSVAIIDISQAHPMRGINVRDATSSDNLTFVVSLGYKNRIGSHLCTGSLITRRSVLTCQHCINREQISNIEVTVGSTNLHLGQKYGIDSWRSFDQWYYQVKELLDDTGDDIAILRVGILLIKFLLTFQLVALFILTFVVNSWMEE